MVGSYWKLDVENYLNSNDFNHFQATYWKTIAGMMI